jgi:hypothetical protein
MHKSIRLFTYKYEALERENLVNTANVQQRIKTK